MTEIGAMIRRDVAPAEVRTHAQLVAPGFDELWVVEDLPCAGGISQMTAALEATDDVVIGHGIAPAPFRNPAALAMEWATLAELHPARVACAIGHGVQSWMAQIGERVESPLTLLRETIEAVRGLLAGAAVDVDGRYIQLDHVALRFPPSVIPLVSAGVVGPKSLRLSGAVADGTIIPEGHGPPEIERARQLIDEGRAEVGRIDEHRLTVFAGFYCGDPSGLDEPNPDATSGWDAVGADPDDVGARLRRLVDAGADAVILVPFGKDVTQQLQLASSEIVPRIRR